MCVSLLIRVIVKLSNELAHMSSSSRYSTYQPKLRMKPPPANEEQALKQLYAYFCQRANVYQRSSQQRCGPVSTVRQSKRRREDKKELCQQINVPTPIPSIADWYSKTQPRRMVQTSSSSRIILLPPPRKMLPSPTNMNAWKRPRVLRSIELERYF